MGGSTLNESQLHQQIAQYLKLRYPDLLFTSDQSGNNKQSGYQRAMQFALNSKRGMPDLQIHEMKHGYGGLFIELKTEKARVFKKDGTPATEHIQEQMERLHELSSKGYAAAITRGWDEAKLIIDKYIRGVNQDEFFKKVFSTQKYKEPTKASATRQSSPF